MMSTVAELRQRSDRASGLDWLRAWVGAHPWLSSNTTRSDVIEQKYRAINAGDAARAARMNACSRPRLKRAQPWCSAAG